MRKLTEKEKSIALNDGTEDFYSELKEIQQSTKMIQAFEWKGEYFWGDAGILYRLYKAKNPSKKFRIFLIDEGFKIQ